MYRFSPNDYQRLGEVWAGAHPEDGQPLEVIDGIPEGGAVPDLEEEPQLTAPGAPDDEMIADYAKRLFGASVQVPKRTRTRTPGRTR